MPVIGISVERLMALVRREAVAPAPSPEGQSRAMAPAPLAPAPLADITAERVETLLDQLGCDVDGVADVRRYRSRHSDYVLELKPQETIPLTDPNSGATGARWEEVWELASTERQVLLELLPVRPDIFDAGGLARALRGYLGVETGLKDYRVGADGCLPPSAVRSPQSDSNNAASQTDRSDSAGSDRGSRTAVGLPATWRVEVDERITDPRYGRPYVQCAVVRNLPVDDDLLRAIMKLQENIHWALCRDRKFASIGAYDLATLAGPIRYTLVDPDSFRFTPLFWGGREPVSPRAMLEGHPKGMAYAHLVAGLDAYPALLDANGNVLALPPIINADETKVTPRTRDLFIDVTGPSLPIVEKALAIMATSLVELDLAGEARIEPVEIVRPEGKLVTPALATESFTLSPGRAARLLGLPLSADDCTELLERMRHGVEATGAVDADGPRLRVTVPAYRTDIMHEVDLIEDIAIAYGYHRIAPELVPTFTAGAGDALNERTRAAAAALTGLGYTETLSLVLTSERNHYERLRRPVNPGRVTVANPASSDQTMLREHLYSSLLEQLANNTDHPLPQRLFEAGDVVQGAPPFQAADLQDSRLESRRSPEPTELRTIAAAFIGNGAGYAAGRAVMDALLHELGYGGAQYRPADDPAALHGRAATVHVPVDGPGGRLPFHLARLADADGTARLGSVFEVHPAVLEDWKLGAPVVLLSLTLGVVEWG
jgi:phenylalanyl-tRNA synthetase beta chain